MPPSTQLLFASNTPHPLAAFANGKQAPTPAKHPHRKTRRGCHTLL